MTTDAADAPPQRLVILDGHAIIFRAYYAMREPLTVKSTGEVVSAVYGFANTLLAVLDDLQPTHIALALDVDDGTTFRRDLDPNYKAHRDAMPEDMPPQIERCRQVASAFGLPIFEAPGFEADDVLATLADQAAAQGVETWIATLDSDLVQLVRDGVSVYMFRPFQRDVVRYDSDERVRDRYGVDPIQIIDFKAIVGDTSDNIPGVKGLGEKGAVKLLNTWRSLEEIYEHLDEVAPPATQKKLREQRDVAFHSKKLATIVHDAPVELDLEQAEVGNYDRGDVIAIFRELEFRSILERVSDPEWGAAGSEAAPAPQEDVDYDLVRDEAALAEWVERAAAAPLLAVDLETSALDPIDCEIAGYALADAEGRAAYIPVGHHPSLEDTGEQLDPVLVRAALRPVLEDPSVPKVLHNAKFDIKVLARHGIRLRGLAHDTMLAAYLLSESQIGLKALASSRLGVEMTPIEALIGKGRKQKSMLDVPAAEAGPYAAADADMTLRLAAILIPELEEDEALAALYRELELPLIEVLVEMELAGVSLDTAQLEELDARLDQEIGVATQQIYEDVGHEFSIASPKQLSVVLFEELGLPKTRKTSQGFSTDAQQLERLAESHPIVNRILQWRELTKLRSTYVESLPPLVSASTRRIHTDYNQTVAATGRLSSEHPNLQNIPVRTELGAQVRAAFVPRAWDALNGGADAGEVRFVSADYSQIELRVLAHLAEDAGLIEAFQRGEDIHAATAAGAYGVEIDDVQPQMRDTAKMMNFGVIYGISAHGLAQRTGMERRDAQAFIDAYFGRFPRVAEWGEEIKETTRSRGYAETLLGRRRYLPAINSANFQARSSAERMALNMPVQGTAADVMKRAMLRLADGLAERELRARMLLQVHDELIFELPAAETPDLIALLEDVMPTAIDMVVPLSIDIKTGPNWRDLTPVAAEEPV